MCLMDILKAKSMELVPAFNGYLEGIIHGISACICWLSWWYYPWSYCLHLLDDPLALTMELVPVFYGYPYDIIHGIDACI